MDEELWMICLLKHESSIFKVNLSERRKALGVGGNSTRILNGWLEWSRRKTGNESIKIQCSPWADNPHFKLNKYRTEKKTASNLADVNATQTEKKEAKDAVKAGWFHWNRRL